MGPELTFKAVPFELIDSCCQEMSSGNVVATPNSDSKIMTF